MSERTIFIAALQHGPDDRKVYLDAACGADDVLRQRVETLIAAHEAAGDFLDGPAVAVPGHAADSFVPTRLQEVSGAETGAFSPGVNPNTSDYPGRSENVGAVLGGRYKLIESIGEGGMGNVFMAQQTHPVKRAVAVKVIKAGMDSRAVLARFEAERQALAMMDHPNIAKVLDGGATESGRPYFVMELVKGVPITEYCDRNKLTPRQRLELFVPVCQAIQHAHQKGIIHRDIKPSNVLVAMYDDRPVPKVIDFGVAKAAGQSLTEMTLMTGFGAVVGTPEYMSPEQASTNNVDIDTRSDVYSLGVLLYELLTGSTPVDRRSLGKAALLEILRIVREVEAPRPSHKLSTSDALPTVAANRGTEPAKLSKLMKGELDWVLLKALDKNRARRYDTANGLARDIQRYLADEVVEARPPSTGYRLMKAWRRNRVASGAVAAVAASLILGLSLSLWQAARAERESKAATAALEELRATAPAFAEQARALAARERFDEAVDKLDYAARLRPDEPDYPASKGDLLQCRFRFSEAAEAYRTALQLRPGDPRVLANVALCEELAVAPRSADGQLDREGLSRLLLAMQREQRSAAELMPASRLLGEEKKLVVAYWLERLKAMPIPADRPLERRLTVRDDGLLALDLSGTKLVDLAPLEGAPLAVLSLSHAGDLTDISALRGMRLKELTLRNTWVRDLSPLRGMATLETLDLNRTPVADLAPLAGLPLRQIEMTNCPVRDLAPLRGAPVGHLNIMGTRVTDLSPLMGMPLKFLDIGGCPVSDFSPLKGLPLEVLNLPGCLVTDLRFLEGMPLRELMLWGCQEARNYAALAGIRTLELLILPDTYRQLGENETEAIEALRRLPKLKQLGAEAWIDHATTRSAESFWKEWDREKGYFAALRQSGFAFTCHRAPDGTYSVHVENQKFSDLKVLEGIPLSQLWISGSQVADLSPLRGVPLRVLGLWHNPVADLSPLRGMPLKELMIEGTRVSDLSPLRGMPLTRLYAHDCDDLKDLSPLRDIPTLENLSIPLAATVVEPVKELPNLKRLGFTSSLQSPWLPLTTPEQFWKGYAQRNWFDILREKAIVPKVLYQMADGTWELQLPASSVRDLSFLSDGPIGNLGIAENDVIDLGPLRGMKLRTLWMYRTKVEDLSPLRGMSLEHLNLGSTPVADLSPLKGMPLKNLRMSDCQKIVDLSPLREMKSLAEICLPPNAKDYEFLREMPNLQRISFREDPADSYRPDKTAAEFWARYDETKRRGPVTAADRPAMPKEVLTPEEANTRPDQVVAVRIAVANTGKSRNDQWCFLNTHADYTHADNFTVAIEKPTPDRLKVLGLPEKLAEMKGRTVVARGKVGTAFGRPQLVVGEDDWIWPDDAK